MSKISRAKLSSTLESKKSHIEQYLTNLLNQVRLMALEYNTDSANYHFGVSFTEFTRSSGVTPKIKKEVIDYYSTNFATPYTEKSISKAPSADEYFKGFTDNHWIMQYNYITANPYPVGEKHKMDAPSKEFSSYSSGHRSYHEVFRSYADALGYGDIYFIDENGLVTYSLNKGFELGDVCCRRSLFRFGFGTRFSCSVKS